MNFLRIFVVTLFIISSSYLFAQKTRKRSTPKKVTQSQTKISIKPLAQKPASGKTIAERTRKPNKAALATIAF